MSTHPKRIAVLAIAGVVLIVFAAQTRKQIMARRLAAIKAAPVLEQLAAEQQLAKLRKAAEGAPRDKQKQWDLANFYLKYNMFDRAARQLSVIIHLDPNDTQAQLQFADASFQVKAYPTADFYYHLVAKEHPMSIPAWQGIAATLTMERRFFEALNVAKHAIKLNPADAKSRLIGATALLNYSLQYPDPRSHAEYFILAARELEPLTKIMPDNAEVFYEYGRALMGKMLPKEALVQLERAVKLDPENADAVRMLAIVYRNLGQDENALKVAKDLNARMPDDPATNDLIGDILISSNQPGSTTQALDALKKAVSKAPTDQYILGHLGEAYEKANDPQSARAVFERVTQVNPDGSFAFHKLALIYTKLGETKLAKQAATLAEHTAFNEQQFKRVQDLSSRHPSNVGLHLILADRLLTLKMYAPARDEYFVVLKLDPGNKRVPRQFLNAAATEIKSGLY